MQLRLLPQASVAVHTRRTPGTPEQPAARAVSAKLIAGDPAQLSVAVATPVFVTDEDSPHWS